ncbi:hypothetical protein KKG41_01730 [Patescibacteria group bacterium]|nr:hypothetical protein [Patescibacteria group bacterium]MBU1890372.1 hypothetical protein [Patescibacteria group bacterium]
MNLSIFDVVLFSYDYRLLKSRNLNFFQMIVDKLKLPAQDCLMIDDSKKNIEHAKKVGLKVQLYKKGANLKITSFN